MDKNRTRKILGTVAAFVLAAACCRAAEVENAPTPTPVFGAVLPDLRYVWFVYSDADAPQLEIWRVKCRNLLARGELAAEKFSVPGDPDERVCAWDAYGDWVWIATNHGIRRIGRLRPAEGKNERFEPELIQADIIGHAPVGLLLIGPRIVIGGDRGLFVFDRHHRRLRNVTDEPIKKLTRSRIGIIAQTKDDIFLVDMSMGRAVLKRAIPEKGENWHEQVPLKACALANPDGPGVVVITDAPGALSFELAQLQFPLAPDEHLREASLYAGRLWLLTTKRLAALVPGGETEVEYDLSNVEVSKPDIVVQEGMLRCGPIAVRMQAGQIDAQVVSLLRGEQTTAQAQSLGITGVQRTTEEKTPKPEEPPEP